MFRVLQKLLHLQTIEFSVINGISDSTWFQNYKHPLDKNYDDFTYNFYK